MGKRIGIEVSLAVANAVKMAKVEVIAAYPITPQTHIVEELSTFVANGELDAAFILVESEHSAMSAVVGSSAVGARTYTATSSQGLAHMHEILFIASGMRLPIVMTIANRALSAPISIWNDHSDIMSERDAGWIQLFAENGQEAFDLSILAFKIAEDKRVLLPIGVNVDGFILTHMIEPIIFPDQAEIDAFLPAYTPQLKLDTADPVTMGPVGVPEVYLEACMQCEQVLLHAKSVVNEVLYDWGKTFGRHYRLVETNGKPGAETMFVTMGSQGETTMTAVERLIAADKDVGQVRLRLWRPFPGEEFKAACKDAKRLIVIDRAMPSGAVRGPVASEIASLFYNQLGALEIVNIIVGIGGRDVTVQEFVEMYELTQAGKITETYCIWGVMSNAE
ncbi:Pyruvate synthase subunit PorA [Desulfovibrionales bacterium]